jgi:hypothetical protein
MTSATKYVNDILYIHFIICIMYIMYMYNYTYIYITTIYNIYIYIIAANSYVLFLTTPLVFLHMVKMLCTRGSPGRAGDPPARKSGPTHCSNRTGVMNGN